MFGFKKKTKDIVNDKFVNIDRGSCEKLVKEYYDKVEICAFQNLWNHMFDILDKEKKMVICHAEKGIFFVLIYKKEEGDEALKIMTKVAFDELGKFGTFKVADYNLIDSKELDFIDQPYDTWLPKKYSKMIDEREVEALVFVSMHWLFGYLSEIVTEIGWAIESSFEDFLNAKLTVSFNELKGQLTMNRILAKIIFSGFTKEYFHKTFLYNITGLDYLNKQKESGNKEKINSDKIITLKSKEILRRE